MRIPRCFTGWKAKMYTGTALLFLTALLWVFKLPTWAWIACSCVMGFCSGKLYALALVQQAREKKAAQDAG